MDNPTIQSHPWIKERRREQNAQAKRRSRARQKQYQEALRRAADSFSQSHYIGNNAGSLKSSTRRSSSGSQPLLAIANRHCRHGKSHCPSAKLNWKDLLHSFASRSEMENIVKILEAENLGISAIVKYGLISMGFALDDDTFQSGSDSCFSCWSSIVESVIEGQFNVNHFILAGVRTLARLNGPVQWRFESTLATGHPGIPKMIALENTRPLSAFLEIAKHIGISFDDLADDDTDSVFTQGWESSSRKCTELMPNLRPVPQQLVVPHHPYLDLIPFPSFRSRALEGIARKDPRVDENQLCFDLMHGGLRCWGSGQVSLHGRGEGAPWDARSWEVTPWFFQKWGLLVGDESEAIYQNSSWWWAHR